MLGIIWPPPLSCEQKTWQKHKMFKFLLEMDDLSGTNAERRIKEVIALGAKATQTYTLKKDTGKFNVNAARYTDAQIEFIKEANANLLYFFGYVNHPD